MITLASIFPIQNHSRWKYFFLFFAVSLSIYIWVGVEIHNDKIACIAQSALYYQLIYLFCTYRVKQGFNVSHVCMYWHMRCETIRTGKAPIAHLRSKIPNVRIFRCASCQLVSKWYFFTASRSLLLFAFVLYV